MPEVGQHREHQRAGHDRELPAVHQRQRRHQQEPQRETRRDAGLHRPHARAAARDPNQTHCRSRSPSHARHGARRSRSAARRRRAAGCDDAVPASDQPGFDQHRGRAGAVGVRGPTAWPTPRRSLRPACGSDTLRRCRSCCGNGISMPSARQRIVHAHRQLAADRHPVVEVVGPGADPEIERAGAEAARTRPSAPAPPRCRAVPRDLEQQLEHPPRIRAVGHADVRRRCGGSCRSASS